MDEIMGYLFISVAVAVLIIVGVRMWKTRNIRNDV